MMVARGPSFNFAAEPKQRGGPYFNFAAKTEPRQFSATSTAPTPLRYPSATPFGGQEASTPKLQPSTEKKAKDDLTVLNCDSVQQWHSPESDKYQGLRVERKIDPLQWQFVADELTQKVDFTQEDSLHLESIELDGLSGEALQQRIQQVAHAVSHCRSLPPALEKLVYQDVLDLASATQKLVPQGKELIVKLELFGPSVCVRWHRDGYVCRSIVSYNCTATEYTADSNVDFYQMKNGGTNDDIIRDPSQIRSIDVGDMLMMKGMHYPGKAHSLVHKSPPARYYNNQDFAPIHIRNKNVQARLILKVDVLKLRECEEKCCAGH